MPRICERQMMRDNQPANDPETYYRITVTSHLFDHLINQLLLRFDTGPLSIVKGFTIILTLMQERIIKQGRASWNTDFMEFAEHYREDIPEFKSFKSELDIWEVYLLQKFGGKLPDRISSTLKETVTIKDTFPNIFCALCILGTVPVTICQCECFVFSLRHLKTYLHSTMAQDRLNELAVLHTHRNMKPPVDAIIDKFTRMHANGNDRHSQLRSITRDEIENSNKFKCTIKQARKRN